MKTSCLTILLAVLLSFSNLVYSQQSNNQPFESIDDVLNIENYENIISRFTTISLYLDSLYFFSEKPDGNYYVQLNVKYFSWRDGENKPETPNYVYGGVFNEVVKISNKIGCLTNIKLSPNVPLKNVNMIEIEANLTRVSDDPKYEKVNKAVSNIIGDFITDATGLEFLGDIITSQDDENGNLLFKANFDIPLNSVEYSLIEKSNPQRLLSNNKPIYITINSDQSTAVLNESLIGRVVTNFSKILKGLVGTPTLKSLENYQGLMKLSFSSETNSIIPKDIQTEIDNFFQSFRTGKYPKAKEYLTRLIDEKVNAYQFTENSNPQLVQTLQEFYALANIYLTLMEAQKDFEKEKDKKRWNNEVSEYFSYLKTHYKSMRFQRYDIKNIYPDKLATIYVPYSLDERSLREFVRWQSEIFKFQVL